MQRWWRRNEQQPPITPAIVVPVYVIPATVIPVSVVRAIVIPAKGGTQVGGA